MTDPSSPTRCLSETDFATPPQDRYFEDYEAGREYAYGYVGFDESGIVEFARRYDPQQMHVDRGYADTGPFHGLIASGWHTGAVGMRLFVEHYLSHVASLASPGMDELRWPRPVRPGDVLHARMTIASARPSQSKPDRGLVHTDIALINQDGAIAMTMKAINILARRP